MIRIFLGFVFLLSACLNAQERAPPTLTADEAAQAVVIESEGKTIYEHDRAAAVATDALAKMRSFKSNKHVRGWITEDKGAEILVTIVGVGENDIPVALYRASISKEGPLVGTPTALSTPEALSDYERRSYAARSSALTDKFESCSNTYNIIVLPKNGDPATGWTVYLLPGTTKKDIVPLGGSYRVDYNSDGIHVVSKRGFTKSCITLPNDPKTIGMMVSHLMDPAPTEVHVFWSLWAHKSMYVGTVENGNLWSIKDGKIGLVVRGKAKGN